MGMHPDEVQRLAPEIIEFSGINERGDFASLPMRTYSSGMAARLRFSIAAAKKHDVLLIDEALATGDKRLPQAQRAAGPGAARGAPARCSWSATSISSIRDTCERTIWLESGVLRMDGPTDEVVARVRGRSNGK